MLKAESALCYNNYKNAEVVMKLAEIYHLAVQLGKESDIREIICSDCWMKIKNSSIK
jgi:hypothetical protein